MDKFFEFASDNPILTFFLALILGATIEGVFKAIASMVR